MVQNIGIILFGIAILCLIWTIAGLVKPQIIIRWAIPEKQTWLRALGFGLSLVLMFGCAGYALQPAVSWWAWVFPVFFAFAAMAMYDSFIHTNEFLAERERKNREEAEKRKNDKLYRQIQERQARVEKLIKENADWLGDDFDEDDDFDNDQDWEKERDRLYREDRLEEWKEELKYAFGKKVSSEKEKDLRALFGGDDQCLYNFSMYSARIRRGEFICHVPPDDHYRPRFDFLEKRGVASKFSSFSKDFLPLLSIDQLRSLGKAAGLKKLKKTKQASYEMLAELPDNVLDEAWPVTKIAYENLFKLKKLEEL